MAIAMTTNQFFEADPSLSGANRIIERYQNELPVNVSEISSALGVAMLSADLGPGISGKICRETHPRSASGYVIYINQDEPYTRQRFTAAHELAHYILHKDQIGDGIEDDPLYRSKLSSPAEAEANRKAADILMPWHLINSLVSQGITDVKEMAKRFEVSETAMAIRVGLPT